MLSDNCAIVHAVLLKILLHRMTDADLGIHLCSDRGHMALLDTPTGP